MLPMGGEGLPYWREEIGVKVLCLGRILGLYANSIVHCVKLLMHGTCIGAILSMNA